MKHLIVYLLSALTLCSYLFGQAPQAFNYQAIIRNNTGVSLVNRPVRFSIAIQQGTSGPVVYQEQHSDTTNGEGLVVFQIGRGTPVNNSILFSNINWSSGPYYTNISIDTLGNGPFVAMGSFELVSVPFALHAGNGLPSGSSAGQMLQWNGTQWVQISPGQSSQILTFCEGRPVWTTSGFCTGVITSINCGSSVQSGLLYQGRPDTITSTISYVGGNGGQYLAQTIASTGVTGLTAVLSRGNFATGNGALSVTISGTPSSSGNASFALVIGSQSCTLTIPVNAGASISTLSCGTSVNAGNPVSGLPSSGVTSSIPYTGGNGNGYSAVTVASTGVLGLTATLPSGVLANGSGSLTLSITGTPQSSGTASFLLNVGGQTCTLNRTVSSVTIGSLSCGTSTPTGSLISGVAASGVSNVISYTGGGGGTYSAQTITSTGVTGLTATLSAGVLAVGNGSLSYTITGIPNAAGTASFFISIGGQTCALTRTVASGSVASLICGTTTNGTLINGLSASSVSSVVSYTGGDGGAYVTQMVQSTGVTGLTAVLDSGLFVVGNGTLTYNITGTPSATGTANFAINIGGRTCTLSRTVNAGSIGALFCDSAQNVGVMNSGVAASGVSSTLPYTGGNGGSFASQTFTSTGVTGLTATLTGGNFTLSSGSLTLTITGTPNQSGRANFALNIGGRTCTLSRNVNCAVVSTQVVDVLNPITNKIWMDRNLGASRAATFQTDNQAYGDYYQWGRDSDGHQCVNSATTSTLSSISTPGHGDFIVSSSDWLSIQDNTLWATDSSITNPCPTGYRLPTSAEWDEERLSWSSNNSAGAFASPLKLTMAGYRVYNTGGLTDWSSTGLYWSSTISGSSAIYLSISTNSIPWVTIRGQALSVRCIKNYGTVTGMTCGTGNSGMLAIGAPANAVTSTVSYTGGNGGVYPAQTINSTGVTGLTASIGAGNLASGNDSLVYSISGTPSSSGTANFLINIGGRTCTLSRTVSAATLGALRCDSAVHTGTMAVNVPLSGVSSTVPYTGGNGGSFTTMTFTSTGVTGLTATLTAGNFAVGNGTLTLNISGTPNQSGRANFALNIGGRTCTLSRNVNCAVVVSTQVVDVLNPITNKIWMDRNLGASRVATSSTDNSSYGDYYQWGRSSDGHQCRNSTTTNTLSITSTPVHGDFIVTGGDWLSVQDNNLWATHSSITNPCPTGYRLPTSAEWDEERLSWSSNNSAGAFASPLKLTMAGYRVYNTGGLSDWSTNGHYWSSTISGSIAHNLSLLGGYYGAFINANVRAQAFSVRCIKNYATVTGITCGTANNGTLGSLLPANNVSSDISYTGGTGGTHNGQVVSSTGVTGLTATLSPGNFVNGNGTLTYSITGTPASAGTANFAINIGGRTCTLSRTVSVATLGALLCDSAAHTGTLDFNLPASGVSSTLPYTGGNGGAFTTMTFTSTGVTGLTATLTAGNFAVGNGTLTLNISGTPNQSGRAYFALNIGGRTCTLTRTVNCTVVSTQVVDVLNPITNKIWMDRDLGASRVATSSTDLQAYGNLYQWGRGSDGHECLSSAATSVMSTLPNPGHGDFITGGHDWQSPYNPTLWTGNFPVTNPCPTGYRPPTPAEWGEEASSWASNTGIGAFASPLKIPMGGFKYLQGTVRNEVNTRGLYWTSEHGTYISIPLSSGASLASTYRIHGFSVRCIKNYATVTGITCGSNTTGALVAGLVANAVSSDVSYTGGTGGTHNGQVVSSTGVTGLTATLSPGNFANGNGTLTYTITGTPASAGTANFAINIGGRTCNLSRIVANGTVSTLSCGGATHVGALSQDITASGITSSIPYLGGNGGPYAAQTINSTGVTGLTATVSAGTFAIGSGSISYTINGSPLTHGTANFAITLGGQTCTLSRTVEAAISNLDCNAAIQTGSLGYGLAATGVTSSIPYTNGYGATYAQQVVNSTGVTGLTATLTGGNFAVGNGSLLYTITGTPTNSGTASFAISIGGRTCTLQRSISAPMSNLVCSSAVHVGTLSQGVVASGVSSSIPYTGGNGGTYPIHTFTSTGVTGLTASLSAGTFASGSGSLSFNITGTPNANGTATFAINIGGVTCSLIRQVVCIPTQTAVVDVYNPTTNQIWMDRNLGATRVPINNTDAQGLGDLYQWGRSGDGHQCRSTGATTALASNDNPGSEFIITPSTGDWRASRNDNLWQGANGTNNPCPAGYRLPTQAEWDAERLSWSSLNTNGAYGSPLRLSLAGYREFSNAVLYYAGQHGYYWSSTISGANVLSLQISNGSFFPHQRGYGFTVRCIKVNESLVSLSCSTAQHTGSLGYGVVANGVSSSIPYTGGDGSAYTGLTIPSTGVTGLTATLSPGTFATGNGSVVFTITGTPSTQGVASFAINNLGGQFCTLQRTVAPPMSNLDCDAAVHTGILNGGVFASGVSSSIPYTGGNGGSYPLHTFTSTGVTGLTATLSAGAFASGSGSLNFNITGTPNANGTATFAINIGGVACSLIREVICIPTTTVVNDVINPTTNRIWMDRNLGATRVSINPTDASGHGNLYQWGRSTDGHQCRSSGTTTALASTDTPGPNFIITPITLNWRASLNNNLWQGTTGTNNPCPTGYRLPTQAEWDAERLSWSSSNSSGAYGSPLRLSMSGVRTPDGAALQHEGSYGFYWSSTVSGLDAVHLRFWSSSVTLTGISRGYGLAVRCIKD